MLTGAFMLYLCQSNATEHLKCSLADKLCKEPLTDPFIDEQIMVNSPGMAQWLQQQIALTGGISAAIKFPMPASFIWKLFQQLLPHVPETSAFSKDSMTWIIMQLLPTLLDDPVSKPLKHYLDPKEQSTTKVPSDQQQIKSYQLAGKIADIFDQYLVYRPDWIIAWERGDNLDFIPKHQQWQPFLWRKITAYILSNDQSPLHLGNLYASLIKTLNDHGSKQQLYQFIPSKRLFIFGISTLPPIYLQLLEALGQHIDVFIYAQNPCQFYWGDTICSAQQHNTDDQISFSHSFLNSESSEELESGNSLLASMGRLGRDYHSLLNQLKMIKNEIFMAPLEYATTMLAQIQSNIVNLEEPQEPLPVVKNDKSLTINSCYSPLREAEVLHDYLLNLLNTHPNLTPKDIIVMAPDVETYSPVIQAVFSSVPFKRNIPFAISDRSACQESPILEAFLKLFNISTLRCTVDDIISLLEVPSIIRRFSLNPEDMSILHRWITHSGIRWGLNTAQQLKQQLPAQQQNTWRFGIERLLLGYAMESKDTLYENYLPSEDIEGLNATICGSLVEFIDRIEQLITTLDKCCTVTEWVVIVNDIIEAFFQPDETEATVLQMVRDTMSSLCDQIDTAMYDQQISHLIVLEWLSEKLAQHKGNQRFLSGKVNVCTLIPMRSIPFKVICLLGMNDSEYPRNTPLNSFDLIADNPRRGDRSRRDDDRYLFLEAILSAREYLYISYNGRHIQDNSARTPSVLLTELINYCQRHFINADSTEPPTLVMQHPLHPFSFDYFQQDSNFYTFAKEWKPSQHKSSQLVTSDKFIEYPLPLKEPVSELAIDDLLTFYRHPCKYFFKHRLDVDFQALEKLIEEDEPFAIDGLNSYQIHTKLIEQQQQGNVNGFSLLKATGVLPHGHFGDLALEEIRTTNQNIFQTIEPYIHTPMPKQEVRLDVDGVQLNGWIKGIYNNSLVRYRPSKNKNKFLVNCFLEHLIWCACSESAQNTIVITLKEKNNVDCTIIRKMESQQSIDELKKWLNSFRQGLTYPLPFFPGASATWVIESSKDYKRSKNEYNPENAKKKTIAAFDQEKENTASNRKDEYILRIWSEMTDELFKQTTSLAETLLLPLTSNIDNG